MAGKNRNKNATATVETESTETAATPTVETATETATVSSDTATVETAATPTVDAAQVFGDLFAAAVDDRNIELQAITDAARAVHGSSRNNRAAQAMANAMTKNLMNGNDDATAQRIVDLYNAARVVPTVERATVDAAQTFVNQRDALQSVIATLLGELSESDQARANELQADGKTPVLQSDADSVTAIANRVVASAKRGQTRNARTDSGKHGELGPQHVAAWIAANIDKFDDGEFVSVGKIAGKQHAVCDVVGSHYYGNENPSVGAIGNVLTTKTNTVAVQGNGWIGQPKPLPRGLIIDKSSFVAETETTETD